MKRSLIAPTANIWPNTQYILNKRETTHCDGAASSRNSTITVVYLR